ncbi:fibrinogen silencer-binding protein isoform X2 [Solenopsis invicta]|uniref:fibrinogen silencer-binding protein isoform X2 n=1 Tax=Solenopsis invicta TaxID=13686 RepID=UPI00193D38A5|nr:fibrinogen silencer-binding protein isoform X2 [Solenopsis invicta]XP_039312772.1 fibrinogen silencer-binding protein isoform X2 [Solenopsis invicta]
MHYAVGISENFNSCSFVYENMEQNKKGRTKNFTVSEKMLLIELVRERCKILENKTTNTVSVKEKEDCWEDLRLNFMYRSNGVSRCVQSLKTCWDNMKKRTKKQYAEEKQAIYKTGGGQYKAISDPVAERVREIIRPSVEGLLNVFDNDCIEGSQILIKMWNS